MLTCIALALAVQQKTFDFDHKGAPVARVVEAMAEAFGEEMKADGTMSRDYVIVAFRDATAERAKQLLADAMNASWIEDDGKLILHRSHAQELEDERTDLAVYSRSIRGIQEQIEIPDRLVGEQVAQFIKVLFETAADGRTYSEGEAMRAMLPGGRALARLAKESDAEFLASLPLGVPVTFSVTGGFGTRQLPNSARPILAEFIQDQNALMELLELRAATAAPVAGMGRVSPSLQDVRVTIMTHGFDLMATIRAPRTDIPVDVEIVRFFDGPLELYVTDMQWPDGLNASIEVSELAKQSWRVRPPPTNGALSPDQPSEELLEIYLNPKEHDFLELAVSEIVIQAAEQSGESFVVVPLDWIGTGRLARYNEISIDDALDIIFRVFYEQRRLPDATIVTAITPAQARRDRVGRQEFANSFKAFRERKRDTLTPLAHVVSSSSTLFVSSLLNRLSALSRTVRSSRSDSTDLLSFYSKMTDGDRGRARTGGAIFSLAELDEEQLALLESIFGTRVNIDVWGLLLRTAEGPITSQHMAEEKSRLRNIRTSGLAIRVQTVRLTTTFFRGRNRGRATVPLQPRSMGGLAYLGAMAERAGLPVPNNDRVFRVVEEQGILMSVISGGSEVHLASYFVPAIYEGDEMVEFDDLSQSFRDQYQAALEAELRKLQDPPR
ncbi:MAG: hypothetical protein IH944_10715 [Armatimonadetes bacterium]|nr:hypothetical protein [Armatimonadota bacterium]